MEREHRTFRSDFANLREWSSARDIGAYAWLILTFLAGNDAVEKGIFKKESFVPLGIAVIGVVGFLRKKTDDPYHANLTDLFKKQRPRSE